MWDQGEEECGRQSGEEGKPSCSREGNQKQGRAKKKRKGDSEVMVRRVKAVERKVGDGRIVAKRIEGGYYRVVEQVPRKRKGGRGGIKGRIDNDTQG